MRSNIILKNSFFPSFFQNVIFVIPSFFVCSREFIYFFFTWHKNVRIITISCSAIRRDKSKRVFTSPTKKNSKYHFKTSVFMNFTSRHIKRPILALTSTYSVRKERMNCNNLGATTIIIKNTDLYTRNTEEQVQK